MKLSNKITAMTVRWLVLLTLLTLGCNTLTAATPISAPSNTVVPVSTPASTKTPSGPFPVGDYKPVQQFASSEIKFLEDGTFTIEIPNEGRGIKGTYVVTGDKIVLNENPGNPCNGTPGTFTWSFDGKTLTLKGVEDKCSNPRSLDLSRDWTKQP